LGGKWGRLGQNEQEMGRCAARNTTKYFTLVHYGEGEGGQLEIFLKKKKKAKITVGKRQPVALRRKESFAQWEGENI